MKRKNKENLESIECDCHPYICAGTCINQCGCKHKADEEQVKWWLANIARREARIYYQLAEDIKEIAINESQHAVKKKLFNIANQIRESL